MMNNVSAEDAHKLQNNCINNILLYEQKLFYQIVWYYFKRALNMQ